MNSWKNPYDLDPAVDVDLTHRAYPGGGMPRHDGEINDGTLPGGMPRRAIAGFMESVGSTFTWVAMAAAAWWLLATPSGKALKTKVKSILRGR